MLDCLPSNEVQVKGCFWCGLQTRVLFCWSSPDLNPKQPDLSNALQTSILNTHLIFISGFNSSSGGCSKSLGPIIPNCRRRVSWKLALGCEQKHQFFATVVVCTSKVGRHSRAAIKQAEKAENRDFRQVRSGMQSVWASPQQGGQSGQKVWRRSGRAGKMGHRSCKIRCTACTTTSFWCESEMEILYKLSWPVLGGDPAARSHRVEQFTAL